MQNRKSKPHKENTFKNYLSHNSEFISVSICQGIEFASKYEYNNAFASSYKHFCMCLSNPCSVIRVVTILKMRNYALLLYVIQNTSTRRSTAKKHFPKGNQIIHVLLQCKFSVMDAGINLGDVTLSSLYWNVFFERVLEIMLVIHKTLALNKQVKEV